MKLRNLVDPPTEEPRGGGIVDEPAANTGRPHTCKLPTIKTLPNADVRFATAHGQPIRGTRSIADGTVPLTGLIDIGPNTRIIMTANDGQNADAQVLTTLPLP